MSRSSTSFTELSDVEYTRLRKSLLRSKGSDTQRDFLRDVRDTNGFLERMSRVSTVGTESVDLAPAPMTESEFKEPPADTECALYNAWSGIPPATACRSTFWANLTLEHLRHRRIESPYLAANGGALSGGTERIDLVLQDSTEKASERIDLCVRTVLRRLGGLPEVRGNRSVYVDCPLARAWWRERWIEYAAQGDAQLATQLRIVVRTSQTYWEKLIDRIVFRNSTFGSANIRSSFLRSLARYVGSNPESKLRSTNGLQRLCRRTTTYQGQRELGILTDDELDTLMTSIVSST